MRFRQSSSGSPRAPWLECTSGTYGEDIICRDCTGLKISSFFFFLSLVACLKTPIIFVFKCIYGNGLNPLHVDSVCFPRPQQIIYRLVTLPETEKPLKSHSKAWKSNYYLLTASKGETLLSGPHHKLLIFNNNLCGRGGFFFFWSRTHFV